jgi:hypothetical protein
MLVSASHSFLCNLQLSVLRLSASLDNMSSTLELSPERPQLSDRLEFQSSMTLADGKEVWETPGTPLPQERKVWMTSLELQVIVSVDLFRTDSNSMNM